MKSKALVSAVFALSVASSGLAIAANANHDDSGRGNEIGNTGVQAPGPRVNHGDFGRNHNDHARNGRGAGPGNAYYQGDRYPAEYRHRQYVVDDWRGHHLSAPPRGYQWVQSGNDYVLIAIASGIISQLLLGR
jgi:Ni/Co efflux regulator RcnB